MFSKVIFRNEENVEISVPVDNLSLQPLMDGRTALCYKNDGQFVPTVAFPVILATKEEIEVRKAVADAAKEFDSKDPADEQKIPDKEG